MSHWPSAVVRRVPHASEVKIPLKSIKNRLGLAGTRCNVAPEHVLLQIPAMNRYLIEQIKNCLLTLGIDHDFNTNSRSGPDHFT